MKKIIIGVVLLCLSSTLLAQCIVIPFNGQEHYLLDGGEWKKIHTGYSKELVNAGLITITSDSIRIIYPKDKRATIHYRVFLKISSKIYVTLWGLIEIDSTAVTVTNNATGLRDKYFIVLN